MKTKWSCLKRKLKKNYQCNASAFALLRILEKRERVFQILLQYLDFHVLLYC